MLRWKGTRNKEQAEYVERSKMNALF
jgi:hypothetical protein